MRRDHPSWSASPLKMGSRLPEGRPDETRRLPTRADSSDRLVNDRAPADRAAP